MRKIRLTLAAAAFAVVAFAGSGPAQSSTCAVFDPDLEAVVCGTVQTVGQLLAPLCAKYDVCFQ